MKRTPQSDAAEPGAGGVALNARAEVLLVRYKGGGWTFPKGHIEVGESDEAASVREVREETGVSAKVVAPLPSTVYTNNRGVRREIRWFLMRTEDQASVLEPLFDAGGFYPPEQAAKLLSYPEDRTLLQEALRAHASA